MELYITFGIIILGVFLFIREYFSIDTTSILIMALFIITGVLSPRDGFSGFNHPATITVACMFVISAGVFKTGLLNGFGKLLIRAGEKSHFLALTLIIVFSASLSAFINDTAVVAMFLPVVITMAQRSGKAPSLFLMPLSFGALLGGVCTVIGTSTNILVSGIAQEKGLEPFGMFEFSGAALWLMGAGILYLLTLGFILIPKRRKSEQLNYNEEISEYVTEIILQQGHKDIGVRVDEARILSDNNIRLLQIKRDKHFIRPMSNDILQENDVLRIMISPESLQELRTDESISFSKEKKWKFQELESEDDKLLEILIPNGSHLAGKSLDQLNFERKFDASVLAFRRSRDFLFDQFDNRILKHGDLLLLLISDEKVKDLAEEEGIVIITEHKNAQGFKGKNAILASIITAGVIAFAALNITSIVVSALVGCLLFITLGLIKPQEAYQSIEWKVIFMLAGVLSMGTALVNTGGAEMLGSSIENLVGGFDPRIALSAVFLVTFLATNIMSNNATAALMAPIAISAAQAMELSERPFLVAVMFAASLSFMTPMSYQTNAMIYTPGGYKFSDFLRVGTPLNILMWIIATFVIPMYFPF